MSRPPSPNTGAVMRFPRVSGDEPVYSEMGNVPSMFSPRERG